MAATLDHGSRRASWRPRITIGLLLLIIAVIGLGLAWVKARRATIIDITAPNAITVDGHALGAGSLAAALAGRRSREVEIRCQSNVPYSAVRFVVQAVEANGIKEIRFSTLNPNPKPAPQGKAW